MTNPFRNQYWNVKNRAENWLEKFVIQASDVVIANTPELMTEFRARFPHERMDKFVTLLNGYDPDDYNSANLIKREAESNHFTITHTGFLYGKRDPKHFLEAVKLAVSRGMVDASKLRIRFVGSTELPYDLSTYLVDSHLQDIVSLQGHVSHQQSLEYMQRADVLLLLQPGTKTQIPSKLFEYLGFKKPILAVSPADGATCQLIASNHLGHISDPEDIESVCKALHFLYGAWNQRGLELRFNRDGSAKFDVRRSTATLASLLTELTSSC
jgi:glycosyltransferase involved in cell wall biosynthesis